jgi:anti-sigma-K factor RskA
MKPMDTQEFLDLCPAHALGLLDGEDLARFQKAFLSATPEMLAAYGEAAATAADLSLSAPEAELSPDVLDRLMARVEASGALPARKAPQPAKPRIAWILPFRIAALVAASLAIVTLGLLAYTASLRQGAGRLQSAYAESRVRIQALEDSLAQQTAMLEVLKSSNTQMVVMNGQAADPQGYGKIIWDPMRKMAILHISNLPAQSPDKDYQLWVIRDKQPVDAGVFQVKGNRAGGELFKIDRLVEADKSRIEAFAITLEPKGGLPKPSGTMYLLGSI